MKKLVVFDLDGTLNQTSLYAVPAHKKAMEEFGVTGVTDEMVMKNFGARPVDYVKFYLPDADEQTQKAYLETAGRYENELIQSYHGEFEGTSRMLQKLKADGYKTAICSNSSVRYITMVLDILQLSQYIDYIQPLIPGKIKDDTLQNLLREQQPDKAVMVGDRIYDWNAAKANRIPFIGCGYGYNPAELAGCDFFAETALCVYDGVKKLIG